MVMLEEVMRWNVLVPALTLIASSVTAGEPLTMEAAVTMALHNNQALRASEQASEAVT